jgi:hypothetical protein
MFFFEKKNQKTFLAWQSSVEAGVSTERIQANKSFLVLFFIKEGL